MQSVPYVDFARYSLPSCSDFTLVKLKDTLTKARNMLWELVEMGYSSVEFELVEVSLRLQTVQSEGIIRDMKLSSMGIRELQRILQTVDSLDIRSAVELELMRRGIV